MKRVLVACALCLLLPVLAAAQETAAAEPLPTVDQILDKHIEASGGKAALERHTTRIYKGSFEFPAMNSTGTWERHEKAPNKGLTVIDIPGFGLIKLGCDGAIAWEDNPMAGLVEKSGLSLARAKRDSVFHRDLKLKEQYKLVIKGKEKLGAREAYLLEATPPEGDVEKFYFDANTGLLIRVDAERDGPQGPTMIQTFLDDFRDVEGCKLPFLLRQSGADFEIVLKVTDLKVNAEVDDAIFAKPAAK